MVDRSDGHTHILGIRTRRCVPGLFSASSCNNLVAVHGVRAKTNSSHCLLKHVLPPRAGTGSGDSRLPRLVTMVNAREVDFTHERAQLAAVHLSNAFRTGREVLQSRHNMQERGSKQTHHFLASKWSLISQLDVYSRRRIHGIRTDGITAHKHTTHTLTCICFKCQGVQ